MDAININLYNVLKNDFKLSDSKAKEFAKAIKEEVQNDINIVNNDFKSGLKDDFHKIDIKIEQLNTKIEQSKSDMIKWFFAFFITIILTQLGLLATILLK